MYGRLILKNLRTGKVVKCKGLFTRNMGYLIQAIFNKYDNTEDFKELKDLDGNTFNIGARVNGRLTFVASVVIQNILFHMNYQGSTTLKTGLKAFISPEEVTPTIDMYNIPNVKDVLELTSKTYTENTTKITLSFVGSTTASDTYTAKLVGLVLTLHPYKYSDDMVTVVKDTLIDVFAITPVDIVQGDPIAVSYKLELT